MGRREGQLSQDACGQGFFLEKIRLRELLRVKVGVCVVSGHRKPSWK
jgi:hypothetical protein